MFTINVEKECGCFKREGYKNNQTFETKEAAMKEAEGMVEDMNETFCQKHVFEIEDNGETITIKMDMRD